MDFFTETGKMAIGSRLRMLTDTITKDADAIYKTYGIELKPKWFPVFFVLWREGCGTITAIARQIGHTHPSVSNIIKEMKAKGLATDKRDSGDGRKNIVALTAKGRRMADRMAETCGDVAEAVESISAQSEHDLWQAIADWETLLRQKSLLERVKEIKAARESARIRIVAYDASYREAFRTLNERWITSHWQMEESDYKALDHPEEYILDKGGHILVALYGDEPAGVCALLRSQSDGYDFELAKLAVSERMRGKGIGRLLCTAVINKARQAGAKRIFLESNTLLKPAIALYRKLGFRELKEQHPAYARGDIQMELELE